MEENLFIEQSSNDPELNGKFLGTITKDFVVVADFIKEASYLMRSRKISDHPIFIMCKETVSIGSEIINNDSEWHYNMSCLDEFVQRAILSAEGAENFIKVYKNPDEFCCIFFVSMEYTKFIYIPYPEDLNNDLSSF